MVTIQCHQSTGVFRFLKSIPSTSLLPHAVVNEMLNRYAIGVRAQADGVGVQQGHLTSEAERGITRDIPRFLLASVIHWTCLRTKNFQQRCSPRCRSSQPCRLCHPRTTGLSVGVSVCPTFSLRDKLSPNCRSRGCSCADSRFCHQRLKPRQSRQELVLELGVLREFHRVTAP